MNNFESTGASVKEVLLFLANALFGGSNGGINIKSGVGKIGAAHVAAVGSGGTPGSALLAVNVGGAGGALRTTITAGGALPAINTVLTVENAGSGYSIADTVAVVCGALANATVHITEVIMEEYDYIVVAPGTVFTELKDTNGTDLLASKNLSAFTFDQVVTLKSGTNYKIRNMLFSGGSVFGYNY